MLLNCGVEEDSRKSLDARRSNQSILKEISNECSLEGLMLKLKLQYFGCLMWRADSFEKTLMLGKIEGGRRRGWQRKRCLLLGRKTMTNLESILKSRDITLLTKVDSQSYGFPVVTYGCESWNIKKTEHRRTDVFKLWCWRRLLRLPWTSRKSSQSIIKEINPEYSLKGPMLKLKLQYFGHLMWRANMLEKTLMLGKIEGGKKRGWQRMRWLDVTHSMDMSLSEIQEIVKDREAWSAVCGVAKSWTWLRDWKTTNFLMMAILTGVSQNVRWYFTVISLCCSVALLHCSFNLHSLIISNVEHLFTCLLAICIYSLMKCVLRSSIFQLDIFLLLLIYMSCFYILEIKALSVVSFANIYSLSVCGVFVRLLISWITQGTYMY